MRLSLTERPVGPDQRDGRGVPEGYQFGETEDSYIVGQQPLPTPTPTPQGPHPTVMPTGAYPPPPSLTPGGRRPLYLPLVLKDRLGGP